MSLTIIIPTFNEGENLLKLIPALLNLYPLAKIIIADDGSTDDTKNVSLSFKGVTFLDRSSRKIKGLTASVIEAASITKTENFVVIDADFQHPPEKIKEVEQKLSTFQIVACRRKSTKGWPLSRKLISLGGELFAKSRLFISRAPILKDPMSGFFGVKTRFFNDIVKENYFVGEGFKVLFDFVKRLPKNTEIGEVLFDFGLREKGESKISKKHFYLLIKSVFS